MLFAKLPEPLPVSEPESRPVSEPESQRLVSVPSTSFACPQILLTDDLPVESELSPLTENEAARQFNVEGISSDSDSDSNCVA